MESFAPQVTATAKEAKNGPIPVSTSDPAISKSLLFGPVFVGDLPLTTMGACIKNNETIIPCGSILKSCSVKLIAVQWFPPLSPLLVKLESWGFLEELASGAYHTHPLFLPAQSLTLQGTHTGTTHFPHTF